MIIPPKSIPILISCGIFYSGKTENSLESVLYYTLLCLSSHESVPRENLWYSGYPFVLEAADISKNFEAFLENYCKENNIFECAFTFICKKHFTNCLISLCYQWLLGNI